MAKNKYNRELSHKRVCTLMYAKTIATNRLCFQNTGIKKNIKLFFVWSAGIAVLHHKEKITEYAPLKYNNFIRQTRKSV